MNLIRKIVIAGAVTMTMCVSLTGCGTKSFDVTETMEITFEGYNGYGVCKLDDEYEWIDDVVDWYGDTINEMQAASCEVELMDTVTYKISPSEGLTNGDTVTITPNIGSAAEDYAFELKGKEITATVKGLGDVAEFDPFENITITFDGVGPNGTINIKPSDENRDIAYKVDKNSGLSNGDVVKITAEPTSGMNVYAEKHGKVFSKTEKTYTVEGLSSYATAIDSIPNDMQDKMKNQAKDSIQASCASWAEGNTLKDAKFIGYYFLTEKEGFSVNPHNDIYLVYEITANLTGLKRGGDGKTQETGEQVYYTYYELSDVMILSDGTCSVDFSRGQLCDNIIESDYGYEDFWVGACFYKFKGYKDLDSMFNNCVTKKITNYSYESTVK